MSLVRKTIAVTSVTFGNRNEMIGRRRLLRPVFHTSILRFPLIRPGKLSRSYSPVAHSILFHKLSP